MTCTKMRLGPGKRDVAIVCVADSETVTLASGRKLTLEWHQYLWPSVAMKNGEVRLLRGKEFDDPNVIAWIRKKHQEAREVNRQWEIISALRRRIETLESEMRTIKCQPKGNE